MTWDTKEEKLLCHMVLNDGVWRRYFPNSPDAYFRVFIVENRKTGVITGKMRFKKRDGTRDWLEVTPKDQADKNQAVTWIRARVEDVFNIANSKIGLPPDLIESFYPPDDGGDPGKTLIWLKQQDLIEFKEVKRNAPRTTDTEPDWTKKCSNCGATPIVPVTGMCGPCTFGKADTAFGNW